MSAEDKSYRVTDGLSEVSTPAFDKSGRYLYIFASTDAGPLQDWFSLCDRRLSAHAQHLRNRAARTTSQSARERERRGAGRRHARHHAPRFDIGRLGGSWRAARARCATWKRCRANRPRRNRESDSRHAHRGGRPVAALTGDAGQVYYVQRVDGRGSLHHYDCRSEKTKSSSRSSAATSSRRTRRRFYIAPARISSSHRSRRSNASEGRLAVADVEVKIDPRAEWTQIFNEAWRINRDYFYAPNMHGVNWEANRKKYAQFLPTPPRRPTSIASFSG